jgi:hypothetical protein
MNTEILQYELNETNNVVNKKISVPEIESFTAKTESKDIKVKHYKQLLSIVNQCIIMDYLRLISKDITDRQQTLLYYITKAEAKNKVVTPAHAVTLTPEVAKKKFTAAKDRFTAAKKTFTAAKKKVLDTKQQQHTTYIESLIKAREELKAKELKPPAELINAREALIKARVELISARAILHRAERDDISKKSKEYMSNILENAAIFGNTYQQMFVWIEYAIDNQTYSFVIKEGAIQHTLKGKSFTDVTDVQPLNGVQFQNDKRTVLPSNINNEGQILTDFQTTINSATNIEIKRCCIFNTANYNVYKVAENYPKYPTCGFIMDYGSEDEEVVFEAIASIFHPNLKKADQSDNEMPPAIEKLLDFDLPQIPGATKKIKSKSTEPPVDQDPKYLKLKKEQEQLKEEQKQLEKERLKVLQQEEYLKNIKEEAKAAQKEEAGAEPQEGRDVDLEGVKLSVEDVERNTPTVIKDNTLSEAKAAQKEEAGAEPQEGRDVDLEGVKLSVEDVERNTPTVIKDNTLSEAKAAQKEEAGAEPQEGRDVDLESVKLSVGDVERNTSTVIKDNTLPEAAQKEEATTLWNSSINSLKPQPDISRWQVKLPPIQASPQPPAPKPAWPGGSRKKICKNAAGAKVYYTGKESSPLGRGYSAVFEDEGKKRKGVDGSTYVVHVKKNGVKIWRKKEAKK